MRGEGPVSWRRLSRKEILSSRLFKFFMDTCETDSGKEVPRYYYMDFPAWVQVIALDEDGQLVLVRQYRYPGEADFLELPGGSVDPADQKNHLVAAKRELLEETGHESEDWTYVGSHYPNPALQNNQCQLYLARNCRKTSELNLDPFEEIEVVKMSVQDFAAHCRRDTAKHSLMMASLFLAWPFLDQG